jgi:hypothetical protein
MEMAIALSDTTAFEKKALAIRTAAGRLIVKDDETFLSAGLLLKDIKSYDHEVDEICDPGIKRWYDGHRASVADKKKLTEPLREAEENIKGKLAEYNQKIQDKIEQDRRGREKAAQDKAEKERRDAARLAEKAGDKKAAKEILNTPLAPVPVAPSTMEIPKVQGVSFRKKWNAEITDIKALIAAVAVGDAPSSLLKIDEVKLRAFASATRGNMNVPGVRFYSTNEVASSSS